MKVEFPEREKYDLNYKSLIYKIKTVSQTTSTHLKVFRRS